MRFKKTLLIGVGSILMFTMGGVGTAQADGGKHISSAMGAGVTQGLVTGGGRCASCHRAHTAKAEYLLKIAQPQLCYSCHADGGGASTNVVSGVIMDGNGTNTTQALRGGGFEKALIDGANAKKTTGSVDPVTGRIATSDQNIPVLPAGATTTSKHLIDGVSAGTAWGNGTDVVSATNLAPGVGKSLTLECGSCHDPHGNGNYRILRPIPVDSGYAVHVIRPARAAVAAKTDPVTLVVTPAIPAVAEVSSTKAGIRIPDASAKDYTTLNYWLSGDSNVLPDPTASYTGELTNALGGGAGVVGGTGGDKPDGYIANIANWCTTCHTRYLATTKSYQTPLAGSTAGVDANFTYRHRSDANYKGSAANCITCHVSHGSNVTMNGVASTDVALPGGPIDKNGNSTAAASADSKLLRVDNRGTCQMCHNV